MQTLLQIFEDVVQALGPAFRTLIMRPIVFQNNDEQNMRTCAQMHFMLALLSQTSSLTICTTNFSNYLLFPSVLNLWINR